MISAAMLVVIPQVLAIVRSAVVEAAMPSQSKMTQATTGDIWSDFDKNCITGNSRPGHNGYHINNQAGDGDLDYPIYASYAGRVVVAQTSNSGTYGKHVVVRHQTSGTRWETLYAHLNQVLTSVNAFVKRGDLIGRMGTTGQSEGVHLHWGVSKDGVYQTLDSVMGCGTSRRYERTGISFSFSNLFVTMQWHVDRNNDGDAADGGEVFTFGRTYDVPLRGDWDGNGTDTPGVFRGNLWYLDNNFDGDSVDADAGEINGLAFGRSGDVPVTGDWDGNGTDTPGVVRGNLWYLTNNFDSDSDDPGEVNGIAYGRSTDVKIAGNWNMTGCPSAPRDTPGIVRDESGIKKWFLNANFDGAHDIYIEFGAANSDGIDAPGDDVSITGNWDATRCVSPLGYGDTAGLVRVNTWLLDNDYDPSYVGTQFSWGQDLDTVTPGDWDNNNTDQRGVVRGTAG